MTRVTRLAVILGMTASLLVAATKSAHASPALRKQLRPIATAIRKVIEEEKQEAVAFAEFPPDLFSGSNAGPGIQQLLIEELQQEANNKHIVQPKANLVVYGKYQPVPKKDLVHGMLIVVKITITVVDKQGRTLIEPTAEVDNSEDIAAIVSYTGALPPNANRGQLNQRIKNALDKPQVHLEDTLIFSGPQSPFAIEVLVKRPGEPKASPRQPVNVGGQAFVDLAKEDVYELRIYNRAKFDAAVGVFIDGLDVFTFSDDRDVGGKLKYQPFYIIPPGGPRSILGWHKTIDKSRKDNVLSFVVTAYGKGAASSRKASGKTGTITVTFAAAWKGGDDNKPADEATTRGVETGFGAPRQVPFQTAPRSIGVVRDVITVRYDRSKAH